VDTSPDAVLAEHLQAPPARNRRHLLHLTDVRAAREAREALHAAAAQVGRDESVLANVLDCARLIWCDPAAHPDDLGARERLWAAIAAPDFRPLVVTWVRELREAAGRRPESGACTVGTALELWSWTVGHFTVGEGAEAGQDAIAELAEVICPLIAARCLALEVASGARSEPGSAAWRADLCQVHAAHAAAAVGARCAELVFGYRRHPRWDAEGCASCYEAGELDALEGVIPGIASCARSYTDVIESDGSHAAKAGPCARFDDVDGFVRLRTRLDACLTGARLARDRAATALVPASEGRAR